MCIHMRAASLRGMLWAESGDGLDSSRSKFCTLGKQSSPGAEVDVVP